MHNVLFGELPRDIPDTNYKKGQGQRVCARCARSQRSWWKVQHFLKILKETKRLCPGIIMMYYMELALDGNDCLGMGWKSPLTFTSGNIGTIIGLSWI